MPKHLPKQPQTLVGRLGLAIAHPLRVRILVALGAGEASPASLTRRFQNEPSSHATPSLSDVAYHINVLADVCGFLEPACSRPVRGSVESFYRLKSPAGLAHIELPRPILRGLRGELFRAFVDATVGAFNHGLLDDQEEVTFSAAPMTVDPQGLAEINKVLREALEHVRRVKTQSQRRLKRKRPTEKVSTLVGAAVFRVAPFEAKEATGVS